MVDVVEPPAGSTAGVEVKVIEVVLSEVNESVDVEDELSVLNVKDVEASVEVELSVSVDVTASVLDVREVEASVDVDAEIELTIGAMASGPGQFGHWKQLRS